MEGPSEKERAAVEEAARRGTKELLHRVGSRENVAVSEDITQLEEQFLVNTEPGFIGSAHDPRNSDVMSADVVGRPQPGTEAGIVTDPKVLDRLNDDPELRALDTLDQNPTARATSDHNYVARTAFAPSTMSKPKKPKPTLWQRMMGSK